MRSHPPPSTLPRIDLSNILPFPKKAYRSLDDSDLPMSSLDPDTSHLLPAKRRRHHVWVQGKLAEVKSLSTANLPRSPGTPTTFEDGVAARERERRDRGRHVDDGACSEGEEPERVFGDCQPRGYGIGGAGNIRRPTDVIHGPTRLSSSRKNTNMYTHRDISPLGADKQRFSFREFLGRKADKKGKARHSS